MNDDFKEISPYIYIHLALGVAVNSEACKKKFMEKEKKGRKEKRVKMWVHYAPLIHIPFFFLALNI